MLKSTYVYGKLPAQDVQRLRRFLEEKLGLIPYEERNNHFYYEVGGAHFNIFPSLGVPSGTHDQLGFVVDDLQATVEHLRLDGVSMEEYDTPPFKTEGGIFDRGYMKAAWFKDSEGNLLSLTEYQVSPWTTAELKAD
ncbi:MAG: VOC family protein [Candidatus Dormibacteria bacterium]